MAKKSRTKKKLGSAAEEEAAVAAAIRRRLHVKGPPRGRPFVQGQPPPPGAKPFQPGQSGNPAGRPPLDFNERNFRKACDEVSTPLLRHALTRIQAGSAPTGVVKLIEGIWDRAGHIVNRRLEVTGPGGAPLESADVGAGRSMLAKLAGVVDGDDTAVASAAAEAASRPAPAPVESGDPDAGEPGPGPGEGGAGG